MLYLDILENIPIRDYASYWTKEYIIIKSPQNQLIRTLPWTLKTQKLNNSTRAPNSGIS